MDEWDPLVLGERIAPGFAAFTAADVPDLRDRLSQVDEWLSDYLVSSAADARSDASRWQLVLACVRRSQHAFDSYHSARDLTADFLGTRAAGSSVRAYYAAVSEWEWFAVDYSMAVDVYRHLVGPMFEKGDGSREYRLYTVANNVKHTSNSLEAHPDEFPAVPLWLSNDGLHSYNGISVTFVEASGLLEELLFMVDGLKLTGPRLDASTGAG